MAKKVQSTAIAPVVIESQIHVIRGVRVMLDEDLAKLYGVPTKRLNEQVSRNRERFPPDFAFQLTLQEVANLKSQIATSSLGYGGRRKLPWAFTEQGVAMLSGVLRSPLAIQVNIEIMRAFVRIRRLLATPGEIVAVIQQLSDTVNMHDEQIRVISEVLRKMLEPPPVAAPKRRIGFHPNSSPVPSQG